LRLFGIFSLSAVLRAAPHFANVCLVFSPFVDWIDSFSRKWYAITVPAPMTEGRDVKSTVYHAFIVCI